MSSRSHLRDQRTKSNSPNEKLKVGDFFFSPDPSFSMPQSFRIFLTHSFRVIQIANTAVVSLELEA